MVLDFLQTLTAFSSRSYHPFEELRNHLHYSADHPSDTNQHQIQTSPSSSSLPNMADQLNMNGLNLGGPGEQRSYIPPHMRGKMGGPQPTNGGPPPAAALNGGIGGSAWNAPAA